MNNDPIPTFRRAARWIIKAAPIATLLALTLVVVGFVGAVTSRSACRNATCKALALQFEFNGIEPEWLDRTLLRSAPWPQDILDSLVPEAERHSMFAPKITYRVEPPRSEAEDRPAEAWGYVVCQAPLPFVVRAHYEYVFSRPRKASEVSEFSEARGTGARTGMWLGGVRTYVCAFGASVLIDDWGTGSTY